MRGGALSIASLIRRHPMALTALSVCAAFALAFGIPRVEFRTGQDTLLNPDSKIAQDNLRFQKQFGGDPMLVLFEARPGDGDIRQLFSTPNREEMRRLESDLVASGHYQSVLTPLLILEFAKQQVERRMIDEPARLATDQAKAAADARASPAAHGESPAQQDAAADAASERVAQEFREKFGADAARFVLVGGDHSLDNPRFLEFVLLGADGAIRPELGGIFPDNRHALMVVRLAGNLSIDEGSKFAADVIDRVQARSFEGVDARVSGPPLLIKEINDKMKSALVVMAIFAVVIMMVVLFALFRARWRLLSLPAVLIGCVAAFGLMGFVGIPLTMVTISGLPILIGLGVDFAIQIHNRIEEETFATNSADAGIENTVLRLGPALGIAAVSACIGFLVLHLSEVPMIRDFGSMLAVGATIVFITIVFLMGSILYLRERTRIGARPPSRSRFHVEALVGGLAGRTVGRLAPIALGAVIIALVGLYVGRKIPTETDPEKFVPSGSNVLTELHHVRDVSGSTSELNLLVETNGGRRVTDHEVLDWMLAFERRQVEKHRQLTRSNSIASFTESVAGEATTASAEQTLSTSPPALASTVVNADRTMASITFAINDVGTPLSERKTLTQEIEDDANAPAGVSIAPAGIAVVGTATIDAVSRNRDLMSFVAVTAILLTLLAAFRNPVKAIAPLLPVVLALGASSMLLYFGGMSYSPLTSISGPLIIAMGTEFNVLLMARYFEERANGLEPRAAMSTASRRIGRAIMASGLTVMGGFAVLAISDFPLLDNFGKVTALNIGLSLLSTLVLLPPLLVWADEERGIVRIPAQTAAEQAP